MLLRRLSTPLSLARPSSRYTAPASTTAFNANMYAFSAPSFPLSLVAPARSVNTTSTHRYLFRSNRTNLPATIDKSSHIGGLNTRHFDHHRLHHRNQRPAVSMCTTTSSSSGKKAPTMVRAKHILVDSEELLDTVERQLKDGKGTFSDLARLVSTCSSKARGGDLGWFRRNVMVKEFEQAAFGNPPGSMVRVKTEFGWHLILIEEHAIASTSISVHEFAVRKDDPDMQRIDVREQSELDVAKLPGFLHLPMGEYGTWADDFENGKFNLDKKKETVVMCHHGMRSANFCSFLAQQGFEHVRNLEGGIHAYATEIDSSVPTYGG